MSARMTWLLITLAYASGGLIFTRGFGWWTVLGCIGWFAVCVMAPPFPQIFRSKQ